MMRGPTFIYFWWRQVLQLIVVIERCQSDLSKIVITAAATCGFSRCLDGWQQQSYQDANDGDYDE
jgi:hypothetical protein